jgi:hypothetical protein
VNIDESATTICPPRVDSASAANRVVEACPYSCAWRPPHCVLVSAPRGRDRDERKDDHLHDLDPVERSYGLVIGRLIGHRREPRRR